MSFIDSAVRIAFLHGVNVAAGELDSGSGNCLIEAVVNNVNHRTEFVEKLKETFHHYRVLWATEGEERTLFNRDVHIDLLSENKWRRGWQSLKNSGIYEVPLFGDLFISVISHCVKKDILIFNIHASAHDPISVIEAKKFGGSRNNYAPIVLAYNGYHYESLIPVSAQDTEVCALLRDRYLNGTYLSPLTDIMPLPEIGVSRYTASSKVKSDYARLSSDDVLPTPDESNKRRATKDSPTMAKRYKKEEHSSSQKVQSCSTFDFAAEVFKSCDKKVVKNELKTSKRPPKKVVICASAPSKEPVIPLPAVGEQTQESVERDELAKEIRLLRRKVNRLKKSGKSTSEVDSLIEEKLQLRQKQAKTNKERQREYRSKNPDKVESERVTIKNYRSKPENKLKDLTRVKQNLLNPENKLRNLTRVKQNRLNPENKLRNLTRVKQNLLDPIKKERNLKGVKNNLSNPMKYQRNLVNTKKRYLVPEKKKANQERANRNSKTVLYKNRNRESKKRLLAKKKLDLSKSLSKRSVRILTSNFHMRKKRADSLSVEQFNLDVQTRFKAYINDFCLQFVCTSCAQQFYRSQVVRVTDTTRNNDGKNKYNKTCLTGFLSVESTEWICKKCCSYVNKKLLPPESSANAFSYAAIPDELSGLSLMEERLCSPRTPFMYITERPSGGQYACKGGVINVPNNVVSTVKSIPRVFLPHELIGIMFMRRMNDKNPYMRSFARPSAIIRASFFLSNRKLFIDNDIVFDKTWKLSNLLEDHSFIATNEATVGNISLSQSDTEEDEPRGVSDTLLSQLPVTQDGSKNASKYHRVAPSEGNMPISVFTDAYAEELSYPTLFGGNVRNVPLTDITYGQICKAEMQLNDRRFARNENMFFKVTKLRIKQIFSKAQVSLRKRKGGDSLTAGDIKLGSIERLLMLDKGIMHASLLTPWYSFLANQRLSPAYFKQLEMKYFASIRQLGKATWFMTLTMAESRWADLLRILYRSCYPAKEVPSDEDLLNLSYKEKSDLIKSDPIAVVRHFDKRLTWLFSNVLKKKGSPVGLVLDYMGSVESQFRGSLHLHFLAYVDGAPVIDVNTDDDVVQFIDRSVSCSLYLPDIPGVELTATDRELPQQLQLHRHRKTCMKGNRKRCRFDFPQPPMKSTCIIRPLALPDTEMKALREDYKALVAKTNFMSSQ